MANDTKSVGFWNTSGPRRQIAIGAGIAAGLGSAALGVAIAPVALIAAGATAAVWNGFKLFGK